MTSKVKSTARLVVRARERYGKDLDCRSLKKCTRSERLGACSSHFPTMSDEDTAEISKVFEPSKTMKYTQWAVSCFREWRSARNKSARDGG